MATGSNYITSLVDPKSNLRNVYRLSINGEPSDKIIASGSVDLQDGMNIVPGLAEIRITETDSTIVWKKIQISDRGLFKFITKPGNYQLHIGYSGYKTDTINLSISLITIKGTRYHSILHLYLKKFLQEISLS